MEPLLHNLGLSSKQILVFTKLMEIGSSTPADLSKLTNLPRPTVYAILEELCSQGFIQEDLMSTKKIFIPTPPDDLIGVLEPLREEVRKKEKLLKELVPLIQTATQGAISYTPRIVYIPQTRMDTFFRAQTEKWNKSIKATGTEYLGFQDYTAPQIFLEWLEWYWDQPSSKDISLRIISNASDFEKNVMSERSKDNFQGRRKILQWDGMGNITFTTWITGDYTILCNTRQRPFYLIEIYDPHYAQSQRQIFETMWNIASRGS